MSPSHNCSLNGVATHIPKLSDEPGLGRNLDGKEVAKPASPILQNGHSKGIVKSVSGLTQINDLNASGVNFLQNDQEYNCDTIKSETEAKESKMKKRVNICTEHDELDDEEAITNLETVALRRGSETSDSVADHSAMSCSTDGCLTMTGTIKRGKKAGQNVDVKLNISREELELLEASIASKRASQPGNSCMVCGLRKGPHVTVWTAFCIPFAIVVSGIYSFYIGTITWYNIFTYYTEEKPVLCRLFISPFLILLYPFLILIFTLGLGIYAGAIQISWFYESWYKEITDLEKGFYGWLCAVLKHEDCSPYEVVILTDIQVPPEIENTRSSSDDFTGCIAEQD